MNPDRRRVQRILPVTPCYFELESQGGGIVLNASEQGLAFQAVAPVQPGGPRRLCISPNPSQRIELLADVVWTDDTHRSGGLRFRELTSDTRNQIREWLRPSPGSEPAEERLALSSNAPPEETEPALLPSKGGLRLFPRTGTLHNVSPAPAEVLSSTAAFSSKATTMAFLHEPLSFETQTPKPRPRFLRAVATGFLTFVFVSMAVLFVQNFRFGIGDLLIRLGEDLKGVSEIQPDLHPSTPTPTSNPTSPDAPAVLNPDLQIPPQENPSQSRPTIVADTGQRTADLPGSRASLPSNSSEFLADRPSRPGEHAPAEQLWSAVAAGDQSAEVALAKLYITGEGVPKNCEQARILLRAASRKGNTEARKELRKLNRSGCR